MNELAEQCGGENLSSFLIKPVQRLLRYKLLMRDVFKCTDHHHQDYEPLKVAIEKLQVVSCKVDKAAGLMDDKSKLESSSKLSPTNQRRRRHRRMISRQIDREQEDEDWKRLSSRSVKISRASVVPAISVPALLPPGLPPSPPKTRSPDERSRLRSVVSNISSNSDLKMSRASVVPTMSKPAVLPTKLPSSPSQKSRAPDERARLRSVVSGLLSASPIRNGSMIVPPGVVESRRNDKLKDKTASTTSVPDSRVRIGRVSKLYWCNTEAVLELWCNSIGAILEQYRKSVETVLEQYCKSIPTVLVQ